MAVAQPPALSMDAERLSAERLNAAIELEVNRRLKERINAVAMSRQAFAVSALRRQQQQQQQQQQLVGPSASQIAAMMLKKQSGPFGGTGNVPNFNFSASGYRALTSDGRPSAPPTNIQGARTA
jgi:NADH dehydrogenase/NADH:ubiquinone oxidoreductase subunit G